MQPPPPAPNPQELLAAKSGGYRYGFNGKEKDDEVSGNGNVYDYGFRIYNPRLGKFLSVDPLFQSYPWYTPYQFAGNTPIQAIDLDGLEELIVNQYYDKELNLLKINIKGYSDLDGNLLENNVVIAGVKMKNPKEKFLIRRYVEGQTVEQFTSPTLTEAEYSLLIQAKADQAGGGKPGLALKGTSHGKFKQSDDFTSSRHTGPHYFLSNTIVYPRGYVDVGISGIIGTSNYGASLDLEDDDLSSNIDVLKKSKESNLLSEINILVSDNLSANDMKAMNRIAETYRKEVGVEVKITKYKSEDDTRQMHTYGGKAPQVTASETKK
jgi:RHS repeat-associated protein